MRLQETAQPGMFIEIDAKSPTLQAYKILHYGFFVAPLVAGIDKFFDKLTAWPMYLWAPLGNLFGSAGTFMRMAGAIEIVAAFLVLFKPKLGAPIVALWLLGIIVNLLLVGSYFDIALRDFGLFLGAIALSRLAMVYDHKEVTVPAK